MPELHPEIHEALLLALRALTDGMVDVPAALRNSRCAKMRVQAKRAIRRVLRIYSESGMAAGEVLGFFSSVGHIVTARHASGHASYEVM
ncbi:MAG: hypothetical protein QHG98_03780 [Methanothrix sp.]|jgi:hypothetical protein|uniref:hypothetical protein n=1 Tax=Methanothrix sp. TaxID=90426 RepID=UPI00247CD2DE|nr:hypothetical protein [Methanothrix sp.]